MVNKKSDAASEGRAPQFRVAGGGGGTNWDAVGIYRVRRAKKGCRYRDVDDVVVHRAGDRRNPWSALSECFRWWFVKPVLVFRWIRHYLGSRFAGDVLAACR